MTKKSKIVNKDGIRKPVPAIVNLEAARFVKISTSQLIRIWLRKKIIGESDIAGKVHELEHKALMKEKAEDPSYNPTPTSVKAYHLAVVVEGNVVEIMRASDGMTEILLMSPDFIVYLPKETDVKIGMEYKNGDFIDVAEEFAKDTTTE
jgi:hypothetical protein